MDFGQYALIALVLAGGSLVQSAAGFGYALFSATLLVLMGFAPHAAIPIVAVAVIAQAVVGIWHHRKELQWGMVFKLTALTMLSLPFGVWVLGMTTELGPERVRQMFGAALLVVLAMLVVLRPRPRDHVPAPWTVAAMCAGGFLSGACGMGGPPIVLWVMAHRWSNEQTRVTLWAIFALMVMPTLVVLSLRFGVVVWEWAGLSLLFIPAVVVGAIPGIWLGNRIPKPLLRRIAIVLLMMIGLFAIGQPLLFAG